MKRQFAIGVAWTSAASWIEQVVSVATFVMIARLVGTEQLGLASMVFAFLFLGEFLVRDTLTEAIVARKTLGEGELEATFTTASTFALSIVATIVVLSDQIARLYGDDRIALYLVVTSPTVLMIGLSTVSTALLRRTMQYRSLAIRGVIGALLGAIVGIAMAAQGLGVWSLLGQRIVVVATNSFLSVTAARWYPKRIPKRHEFRWLRDLAFQVVALRALTVVVMQSPAVFLGMAGSPSAVGVYAFAARLIEVVQMTIIGPIIRVAQSAIAELRRRGGGTSRLFVQIVEVTALLSFSSFAGLALISEPANSVLVGSDWSEASPLLPLLCLGAAIMSLGMIQEAYLLALNKPAGLLKAAGFEAVVGFLPVAFAAPFGSFAVAAAVAIRTMIAIPVRTLAALGPEDIPAGDFGAVLVPPLVPVAAMSAVVAIWLYASETALPDYLVVLGAIGLGIATHILIMFTVMREMRKRLVSFLLHD